MLRNTVLVGVAIGLFALSGIFLWVATLEIPTLAGFGDRNITQSTKIYDRTGDVLLFDLHEDVRRTVVPLEEMSRHLKNATIAIEDAEFYDHNGIRIRRTLKAVYDNIVTGELLGGQGGSTITQQTVKMTLLTHDKKLSRKVKEWILALKVEQMLTKDDILELYLNEVPYGGNIYGAEEAAQHFFSVSARDLTLTQAAYLAALPQAPSRYSPYGNNIDLLEARKNQVLEQMLENGFISKEKYKSALSEEVRFEQYGDTNIKAPHFVFYVREYLEEKYGRDAVYEDGLKVITTLDYELQQIAEEVVREFALQNEEKFNAENAGLVAIDPQSGHILAMVGSRDYFDENIDGKFNVTTARRQPGSTFKPIVYTTAFEQGYTPETTVFDVPTQFSTSCEPNILTSDGSCYSPINYDGEFRGPMTFRNALAQSINIPAVKALYLVGVDAALQTAEKLGITSLTESGRHYGLPLVLGGGEVSLLELTSAYATFANDGERHPHTAVIKVENNKSEVLEEYKPDDGTQVISKQSARLLTDILTDIDARTPAYGENSFSFGSQEVAVKTGTTNNFRDVWIMGYTPHIAVGTWGGNNDNSPIVKKVAGFVLAPLWRSFMDQALTRVPKQNFTPPETIDEVTKPVLRGFWQGVSTTNTSNTTPQIHSILHWVTKSNPRGPIPKNPEYDAQYDAWEYAVKEWVRENTPQFKHLFSQEDNIHQTNNTPQTGLIITNPKQGVSYPSTTITASVATPSSIEIKSMRYYIDGSFMGSVSKHPFQLTLSPLSSGNHIIRAVGHTTENQIYETINSFSVE